MRGMPDMPIVVVDDASDDSCRESTVLLCRGKKDVELLVNGERLGAAASRNAGAEYAKSEWLCFLDDDDQLFPEFLGAVSQLVEKHPGVNAWVPNVQGERSRRCGAVLAADLQARNRVGGCSGFMIKKSVFEAIGGFDPDFPSMQDWDLWIRLQRRGALHYSGVSGVVYDSASQGKITHDLAAKYQGLRRLYLKHRSYWTAQARRAHLRRLSVLRCLRSGQCGLWSNWFKSGLRLEALYYTYHWRRFAQEAGRT